jgi:endonuclease/exonuclease/phosphatase (EEP) superfamily protein YafD
MIKHLKEFLDLFFLILIGCVVASIMARFHWVFNLFDQFWFVYWIVSVIMIGCFFKTRQTLKMLSAMAVFVISLTVLVSSNKNPDINRFNSHFKMYYHNVHSSNRSSKELLSAIKKTDAEIISLVEMTPSLDEEIRNGLSDHSNIYSLPRDDQFGVSIYSKYPFDVLNVYGHEGIPLYVKFYLKDFKTTIYLVHLIPPMWREAWNIQKETLFSMIDDIHKNKNEPYLVVGDFNMTPWSTLYQIFLEQLNPLYSTSESYSEGTWPAFMPQILSLPIDHVFSNRKFIKSIEGASGSDHRALVLEVE